MWGAYREVVEVRDHRTLVVSLGTRRLVVRTAAPYNREGGGWVFVEDTPQGPLAHPDKWKRLH